MGDGFPIKAFGNDRLVLTKNVVRVAHAGSIMQIEPDISSCEMGIKLASDGINIKCFGSIEDD